MDLISVALKFDAAIDSIETAARRRSSSMPFLVLTPAFDALHPDARFVAAAGGLPPPLDAPREAHASAESPFSTANNFVGESSENPRRTGHRASPVGRKIALSVASAPGRAHVEE